MANTTNPFLLFFGLDEPDTAVTLVGANYGTEGTELTGTLADPSGVVAPSEVAPNYNQFHGGYLPDQSNVSSGVTFGAPPQVGTLGQTPPTSTFTSISRNNAVLTFRPGKNLHIPVEFIDAEGQDVDLANGIADLSFVSGTISRDGADPIPLGSAGITFLDPGGAGDVGDYSIKVDQALLEDSTGTVLGPTVDGDKFKFEVQAEYAPGEFVKVPKQACVEAGPTTGRPRLV